MRAVVIGSGMAGLTAAAYLSQQGNDVTVCEQFDNIGGVTATYEEGGFSWDLGPLLIDKFEKYGEAYRILKELGIENLVELIPGDRSIAFPDFILRKPEAYEGKSWRAKQLKMLFPEEEKGIDAYYRFYEHTMAVIAEMRRMDMAPRKNVLSQLKLLGRQINIRKYADWTAEKLLAHWFKSEKLRAVYAGILADFCVLPKEFAGLAVPWCNPETAFDKRITDAMEKPFQQPGYCYIKNGTGMLVDAFAHKIEESGGRIRTGCKVEKILVEEGKTAGVRLSDGEVLNADILFASGGAKETFYGLVGREYLTSAYTDFIERAMLMESVLMVHLGLNFDPAECQPETLCYYYGTFDISGGVLRCRDGLFNGGDDGFLIYVPSAHSKKMAPPNCHAITIYTIAPNVLSYGSWKNDGGQLADRLVENAMKRIPWLKEHTIVRRVMTPLDFQKRTGLKHHGFGGMVPAMGKNNPPHITPVKNLYFIGAQSESGGGVAGVMLGARKIVLNVMKNGINH